MTMPALSEEQAPAADPDQVTLTGAPKSRLIMASTPDDEIRFHLKLFRCRRDVCRGLPPSRSHDAWIICHSTVKVNGERRDRE
jgi:hypothetical protein